MNELRFPPTLQIVPKAQSDALRRRQEVAAAALGTKWALHPDNGPPRSTGTFLEFLEYVAKGGDINAL
jgi:hypothetical protein